MKNDVLNQVPPLQDCNLFRIDPLLAELEFSHDSRERLQAFGELAGSADLRAQGVLANLNPPVLHTHDRSGRRIDQVAFHPAYHRLMEEGIRFGIHSLPWESSKPTSEAHLERAVGHYLLTQTEAGVGCPLTMTFAVVPALARAPQELRDQWLPKLTSRYYDSRFLPVLEKTGATMGMAMTEKQGGSDVRANVTRATRIGKEDYVLRGHKWFCSAPMSDAFLVLAQAQEGLTCFFVPRFKPDGTINEIRLVRLKDKLGNKSNASSEVEYEDAWAVRVGDEGRGVSTIIEMVNHTRLDCVIGSTSLMRAALVEALHYTRYRWAFGAPLVDQPLMKNVLADLCLEAEAAWRMMVRLCQAYGRSAQDPREALFARVATAVAKFWVCKRAPMLATEALECLGGNGYIEEFPLARIYRESLLSSVWEGSGNVISLDVQRALKREPEAVSVFIDEVSASPYFKREQLEALALNSDEPFMGRRLIQTLAIAWQVQLMMNSHTPGASELFARSRLKSHAAVFGGLDDPVTSGSVLDYFLAPLVGSKFERPFVAH